MEYLAIILWFDMVYRSEASIERGLFDLFNQRELQILRLRAVGLTVKEVASSIDSKPDSVRHTLKRLYKALGVSHELGAGLLIAQAGPVDTEKLAERVDITGFGLLSTRQREVLDTLIGAGGRTNQQIADCLAFSVKDVKNRLECINERLGATGRINRVGLGVGYWLYKADKTNIPRP